MLANDSLLAYVGIVITRTVCVCAGPGQAAGPKGASVRSNKPSVGWAARGKGTGAGAREEAQSPKVSLLSPDR